MRLTKYIRKHNPFLQYCFLRRANNKKLLKVLKNRGYQLAIEAEQGIYTDLIRKYISYHFEGEIL